MPELANAHVSLPGGNLTAALVAFQAELPDVSKGSTNPAFKSKYADLADVTKAVFPVLAKYGLAFTAGPAVTEHGPVLRYALRHESGEVIEGEWPLPEGVKAQELGAWITYGRRYCLSAVTGITPDEDDDGNTATTPTRTRQTQDTIAAAVSAIHAATDAASLDRLVDLARQRGIEGVDPVKAAIAARRAEVGESTTDSWEAAPVPA